MIDCDAPVRAFDTSPSYRHHFGRSALIYAWNQSLIGGPRLVHNHPSGDPTPSHADIVMTRQIVDIAKPLGIAVHDHIVVGREGHASFRALRLI